MSRVLKTGDAQITYTYAEHCDKVNRGQGWAKGVDIVKNRNQREWIVAHTDGKVIKVVDYLDGTNNIPDKEGMGYGNYVMLAHKNNVVTLYAHLEQVQVKPGQEVKKGEVLGFMSNTGGSFNAHLHFEVRQYKSGEKVLHDVNCFEWLNAQSYVNTDLPNQVVNPTPAPLDDLDNNTIPNRFKVLNKDGKQLNAYTNYGLACSFAESVGAIVIDSANNNKQVYPKEVVKKELTADSYPNYTDGSSYKVMTRPNGWSGSKGTFSIFKNAYNQWEKYKSAGYHVYDNDWKQLD